jgi:hypothetical protein
MVPLPRLAPSREDGGMRRWVVAAAVISLVVLEVGSAGALGSTVTTTRTIRSAGRCTGGDSTYSLVLSRYDRNTLRVRFRITNSRRGHTWQIFGSDNGMRIFAVKRVVPSDGSVSVKRRIADRHRVDRVKVASSNSNSGEACNATLKGF